MTNNNNNNVDDGLSFVEAEAWDNADTTKRQSDLRHALSVLYSDGNNDSSKSQTIISDDKMEEDVRATITFTDDEKSLEEERTTTGSGGNSSSTDDAFSLSDIEDEHTMVHDCNPQTHMTTANSSNHTNTHDEYSNNYNSNSHGRKIDSSNMNHSYVYSTLSNPSFGSKIDIIGGSSSFHTQTQYSSFHKNHNNSSSSSPVGNVASIQHDIRPQSGEGSSQQHVDNKQSNKTTTNLQQTPNHQELYKQYPISNISMDDKTQLNSTSIHNNNNNVKNEDHNDRSQPKTPMSQMIMSPSNGEYHLSETRVKSLEVQLRTLMEQKHTLQNQLGDQRSQMEDLELSRSEAKEELALLKTLWEQAIEFQTQQRKDVPTDMSSILNSFQSKPNNPVIFPKLEDLRGTLLQNVKQNLISRSHHCHQLQLKLNELESNVQLKESNLTAENNSLKEQIQKLSLQTQANNNSSTNNNMPPPSLTQTLHSFKEKARRNEEEFNRQTEQHTKDMEKMHQQIKKLKHDNQNAEKRYKGLQTELENLKPQSSTNKSHQDANVWKSKAKSLQKERDGLREEINELIRSRGGQPQKALERKYQVEIENMRHVTEQVKAEADEKISAYEIMDMKQKEELESAYESKLKAEQNLHKWKTCFQSLVSSIYKLEKANCLSITCTNLVVSSLGHDHVDLLRHIFPNGHHIPDWKEASSAFNEALKSPLITEESRQSNLLSSSTQTDLHDSENPTNPTKQCSVGINTDKEDSPAKNNVSQVSLLEAEKHISQMEREIANLQGSNSHLEEQIIWYQQRVKEMKLKSEALASPSKSFEQTNDSMQSPYLGSCTTKEVNHMKMENARYQQEVEILKEARQVVEEENRKILNRCISLEQFAEEATKECEVLSKNFSELQQKSDMLLKERDNDQEKIHNLMNENEALRKNEENLKDQLGSISDSYKILKNEYDTLVRIKEENDSILKSLGDEKSHLEARLDTCKNDLEILEHEKTSALEKVSNSKITLGELKNTIDQLEKKLRIAENKVNAANIDRESVSNQTLKLTEDITRLESKCEALELSNLTLSNREKELENQCTSLRQQYISSKERNEMYESNVISMKAHLSEVNQHNMTNKEMLERTQSEKNEISKELLEKENRTMLLENELAKCRAKTTMVEKELSIMRIELKTVIAEKLAEEEKLRILKNQLTQISASKDEVDKSMKGTTKDHELTKQKLESCQAKLYEANNRVKLLIQKKENIEGYLGTVRSEADLLSKTNSKLKADFDKANAEKKALSLELESFKTLVNELNHRIETLVKEKSIIEEKLNENVSGKKLHDEASTTTDIDRFYQNDENSIVKEDIDQMRNEMKLIKEEISVLSATKKDLEMSCMRLQTPPISNAPDMIKKSNDAAKSKSSHCYIVTDDGDLRVKTTVYGKHPNSGKSHTKNDDSLQSTPAMSKNQNGHLVTNFFPDSMNNIGKPRRLELSCHKSSHAPESKSSTPLFSVPLRSNIPHSSPKETFIKQQATSERKKTVDSLDDKLNRLKLSAQRASMIVSKVPNKTKASNERSTRLSFKTRESSASSSSSKGQIEQHHDIKETEAFIMDILSSCGK